MEMNPIPRIINDVGSNENVDVDWCPICLDSLQQSLPSNIQPIVLDQSSSLLHKVMVMPSYSDSRTTMCTVGTCGHCFHASCFMTWNTRNLERKTTTKCPTCNSISRFCLTINNHHPNLVKASSEGAVVSKALQELPYTVVCVPCGHVFFEQGGWKEWSQKTIQANEEKQISFRYSTAAQLHLPCQSKCPLCGVDVACVIRSHIKIPSKHPISMLNHLSNNDLSAKSTNPNISNYLIRGIPDRISVTEAGNPVVNGVYHWNGKFNHNSNRYIRYGIWNNMLCNFNIFLCQMRSGKLYWYISIITDFEKEATEHDIDFYRASIAGDYSTTLPPKDGWDVVGSGMHHWKPNPILAYQYDHNPFTHSDNDTNADNGPANRLDVMNYAIKSNEQLPIPICPNYIVVEGAGHPAVNGTYEHMGYLEGAPQYFRRGYWNNMYHRFFIFLCSVGKDTKRWYISVVPYNNIHPGTSSDIDFYQAPTMGTSTGIPPRVGWMNADKGDDPAPQLMYFGINDHPNSSVRNP